MNRCMTLGGVVGMAIAFEAGRILERVVPGVGPAAPSTFAIVIPVLVAAAAIATVLPARRASRVDPVKALRQE